jgi:hypothetical protein
MQAHIPNLPLIKKTGRGSGIELIFDAKPDVGLHTHGGASGLSTLIVCVLGD